MSGAQEVALKIQIVRQGEVVETRRRRLVNPSFEVVARVAGEFARGRHQLQYVDEDGDVVTMSSQEEWEECVACWDGAKPLRVRIDLCSGARGRASRSSSSGSDRKGHGCTEGSQPRRSPSPAQSQPSVPFAPRFPRPFAASGAAADAKTGEKCKNCDFKTTGLVDGFCCKKCKRGKPHGKRCKESLFVASEADQKVAKEGSETSCGTGKTDEPLHSAWHRHPFMWMKGCPIGKGGKGGKGMPHPGMKGMLPGCSGEWKGAHGAGGKGFKGMFRGCGKGHEAVDAELIGQKCSNCDFETTGIVDSFCCRACRCGKGHGRWCAQKVFGGTDAAPAAATGTGEVRDDGTAGRQPPTEEEPTAVEGVEAGECVEGVPVYDDPCVPVKAVCEPQCPMADSPACDRPCRVEEQPYAEQIALLESMGVVVTAQVVNQLAAADGDVTAVLNAIFS
ncbi:hypothetical protein DIPPA_10923 [Diplonema papillatum]|nr:hypothetical protein DIPPA_10923 [Diplonema papillatum]